MYLLTLMIVRSMFSERSCLWRPLNRLVSPRARQCVQGTSIVGEVDPWGIFGVTFVWAPLETGSSKTLDHSARSLPAGHKGGISAVRKLRCVGLTWSAASIT